MKDIEKNISTLIQSQFPSFYNEEGELLVPRGTISFTY